MTVVNEPTPAKPSRRRRLAIIVGLVVLFNPFTWMGCWLGGVCWLNAHPKVGENVQSVNWLPAGASRVSYYKAYSFTAFEFDIEENGFRQWASRWELKDIREPQSIMRYNYFVEDAPSYGRAHITDGLYDEKRGENGGGYHVVYDRTARRAYFQSNPR
ncbi:MAG TPA: hypothetical protein PK280_21055 [Planctomycetota bacterium]|nr:hypothetical protein [Planctomycetota bacterium]